MNRKSHWDEVYANKAADEVSWYQAVPTLSLALLREVGAGPACAILDVGGGDSRLVDSVLAERLGQMTVLDISGAALERARARLGERSADVTWVEADITTAALPAEAFDVWHDRAVFHFLTAKEDRVRYAALAEAALRRGGMLLLATFAPDGPPRCSGLDVMRYSPSDIAHELGNSFELVRGLSAVHQTPAGREQRFSVAVLRRR
ncbi:MAG TPA: class I SAM-dependent methyltransferase [Gemmatimonadaceae bacterium]